MKKPAFDQPLARFTTVKKRYDSLGRVVEEKLQVGSGGAWRTVSHDMRSVDVADAIYPGGRQVDYAYWQNRTLASVKDHGAGSDIADYDYIGGRVLKRTMQNGVNLDFENGAGTYYDSLGRPTTWKHVKSGTMKIGFDLAYDQAGNPTAIDLLHDTAKGSFSGLAYDSANRLLSSTHAGAWSGQPLAEDWTLDGVGNMKYVDGYTTGSRLTTSFNEYYSVAGVTNTQDDNGNLTSDGTLTYKWDGFNRLSEVKNGGTTVADYTYDAEGRRVAKVVGGTTTCYALDGWREIAEYTGTGASYPDREFVFGSFIDEPLVLDSNDNFDSSATGSGDNRYFYHQNWQYSVCALTNGSGTVVEGYEYEPYGHHRVFYHSGSAVGFTSGDTIMDIGSSHYGNSLLYTGRRFDPETGLQYSRNRYYWQDIGRFISRDPIGHRKGNEAANGYLYISGNPMNDVDCFGLFKGKVCVDKSCSIFAGFYSTSLVKPEIGSALVRLPWPGGCKDADGVYFLTGIIKVNNLGTIRFSCLCDAYRGNIYFTPFTTTNFPRGQKPGKWHLDDNGNPLPDHDDTWPDNPLTTDVIERQSGHPDYPNGTPVKSPAQPPRDPNAPI